MNAAENAKKEHLGAEDATEEFKEAQQREDLRHEQKTAAL